MQLQEWFGYLTLYVSKQLPYPQVLVLNMKLKLSTSVLGLSKIYTDCRLEIKSVREQFYKFLTSQ